MPTIAVFTKNRTNPAYTAARLGADRTAARSGARTVHYVPDRPDDVAEQIVLVGRAIADRPDAVVFVPVHATAMNASVRKLNAAGIPTVNYLKISCVATEAAIRHLRGEPVPREIELPVQIVDTTNYQPWDRPLEERECPRWEDMVK